MDPNSGLSQVQFRGADFGIEALAFWTLRADLRTSNHSLSDIRTNTLKDEKRSRGSRRVVKCVRMDCPSLGYKSMRQSSIGSWR